LSKISFSSEFGFEKGYKGTINQKQYQHEHQIKEEDQSEEFDLDDILDILE
jgi:hypothetical protein